MKIKDKKIVHEDSEHDEESKDDQDTDNCGDQMLKSLFNLKTDKNGEPDFVIKKKGQETRVFLDL